jgi:predicted acetyltransferase
VRVSLKRATQDDAPLLENLLELYIHDLSDVFSVLPGPDGRFGYDKLPLYWSEPDRRYAFLIEYQTRVVGFVLVTRGSPASENPDDLDVAEFFVLRGYRRLGVGRQAAVALWDSLPGQWVVRVAEANRAGQRFWADVVGSYASGATAEGAPRDAAGWRVFTFASRPRW